jgi:hypothetical protein
MLHGSALPDSRPGYAAMPGLLQDAALAASRLLRKK